MTEKETPNDYLQNRTFSLHGTPYKDLVHLKDALEAIKTTREQEREKWIRRIRNNEEILPTDTGIEQAKEAAEQRGYEKAVLEFQEIKIGRKHSEPLWLTEILSTVEQRGYKKGKRAVIENGLIRGAEFVECLEKTKDETAKEIFEEIEEAMEPWEIIALERIKQKWVKKE